MMQHSNALRWVTISNALTCLRLVLTPWVMTSIHGQQWCSAFIIFIIASATDVLDGYVARAFNEQTQLGTLLDPIADKCLLLGTFCMLVFAQSAFFHIPLWFFIIIVCRELMMFIGSLLLLFKYKGATMQPLIWGKAATFLQIIFVAWLFICYFLGLYSQTIHNILLVLLSFFSLLSLYHYIRRAVQEVYGN